MQSLTLYQIEESIRRSFRASGPDVRVAQEAAAENVERTHEMIKLNISRHVNASQSTASWLILAAFALCFAFPDSASASLAEPIQQVIPVSVDVGNGNITVGTQVYSPLNYGGNVSGMFIVVLHRNSLSLIDAQWFCCADPDSPANSGTSPSFPSGVNEYLYSIGTGSTPDAIVIISAYGQGGSMIPPTRIGMLQYFGAAIDLVRLTDGSVPFAFIGHGGLQSGQAHQVGGKSMSGYFAQDSHTNYLFIQPDYLRFDILLDGTIKIGSTIHTPAAAGGCHQGSGFHMLVVPRDSPESTPLYDVMSCTNSGDANLNAESFQHLAGDLTGKGASWGGLTVDLTHDESYLVFLASSGNPIPADVNFGDNGDARMIPVAIALDKVFPYSLGGYYSTFVGLGPNDTYSFVGSAPPPPGIPGRSQRSQESSTLYPGHPSGELHGILSRGHRGNWYSPVTADTTGRANLDFYGILGQKPVPFPHPANQAELDAFNSIGNQICSGSSTSQSCDDFNVRNSYADTNISIGGWKSTLQGLKDPTTGDCGASPSTPFCIVRAQLLKEFQYVLNVRAFNKNLDTVWLASGALGTDALLTAYQNVQQNVQAPSSSPAESIAFTTVNAFMGFAGLLAGPELSPVLGAASTVMFFAEGLATLPSGNSVGSEAGLTVGDLATQASDAFIQQAAVMGTQFNFIYQDWGKLSALGAALQQSQTPGSPWYWDGDTTTSQILEPLSTLTEQSFYRSLLPAVYAIGIYVPGDRGGDPLWKAPYYYASWCYHDLRYPCQYPFATSYAAYTYAHDPNPYPDPGTQTLLGAGGWLGISRRDTPTFTEIGPDSPDLDYLPPTDAVMAHLFQVATESNGYKGLGVYRPDFFEGWKFGRVSCQPSIIKGTDGEGGCDWSAAVPPLEVAPPLAAVGIRVAGVSRSDSQVAVQLTITNNGTLDFKDVKLERIFLRTLTGSGSGDYRGKHIDAGALPPGKSITITLNLNVPASVQSFLLSEEADLQYDGGKLHKLPFEQLITP
jgi:hypothetical protein